MSALAILTETLTHVTTNIPDPGGGEQPPGTEGIVTIIRWCAWGAAAICLVGVIIAGGSMAVQFRRGEGGGEGVTKLGWALLGAIVVGSASALVAAVI